MSTTSQNELARELNISPRRVRQLKDLGVVIAEARGAYDVESNARRYRIFADRDPHALDRLADDMGSLAEKIDRAIAALEKRFILPKWAAVARLVTDLDQIWALSIAMRPEGERAMLSDLRMRVVEEARSALLHLALAAGAIREAA